MRLATLAVVALLLTMGLAGCVSDDPADPDLQAQAEVTDTLGGLQGVVTDPAVQPVADANVTLVEIGETVTTAEDGSYAFSNVQPGTYTVTFSAPGFVSSQHDITIQAGEVATIDAILIHLSLRQPFTQEFEMNGFVECGVGWKQEAAEVISPLLYDSAFAACAVPNLYLGGNTTNDKFLHRFDLEAPLTEVVYELTWSGGGTAVTDPPLRTIMEVQGFINANGSRIMDHRGTSPIQLTLGPAQWSQLSQNFTDRCEGNNGSEANDAWCGYNFRDTGWPMVLRIFATGDCTDTPASACLVLQEGFTHYVSAFYNQRAPDRYTLIG